jgi:hypothetical protein
VAVAAAAVGAATAAATSVTGGAARLPLR